MLSRQLSYAVPYMVTQMDFLEHPAITDVIVPAVVMEEVRARNQSAFQRLKSLTNSETKRFYVFANENHK